MKATLSARLPGHVALDTQASGEIVARIERIMAEQHTPSEKYPFKALDGKK